MFLLAHAKCTDVKPFSFWISKHRLLFFGHFLIRYENAFILSNLADNEIEWGEILTYPGNADKVLRNSSFPKMLRKSLSEPVSIEDLPDDAYFELKEAIHNNGFYIQELPE